MYAQVIDDDSGRTLVTASTLSPTVRDRVKDVDKKEAAKLVGRAVAEAAKAKGIDKVVYDRNGFLYHGRVAVLAESAREAGLEF
jgi:large subunit ribosomal protein L18